MQTPTGPADRKLDCLYYPFSRLLDPNVLKYLTLIYDSITFLDEAEDASRRRTLLEEMRPTSPLFEQYDSLADDYGMLEDNQVVRVLKPPTLTIANSELTALSVVADLQDPHLTAFASRPERYGLPSKPFSGNSERPAWETFQAKIPAPLKDGDMVEQVPLWTSHVLQRGDAFRSWTLSYEAGSFCTVNYYLAAAEQLALEPITTSQLHHGIVLTKLKRAVRESPYRDQILDDDAVSRCRSTLSQGEILRLIGGLFPPEALQRTTFKDIVKFRAETVEQRRAFLHEIGEVIRIVEGDPTSATYDRAVAQALRELHERLRLVQSELGKARDKLLPSAANAALYGAAGTGALGSLATFLGGLSTLGVVAASALTAGGALASKVVQYWSGRRQIAAKQDASISYLLTVGGFVKK